MKQKQEEINKIVKEKLGEMKKHHEYPSIKAYIQKALTQFLVFFFFASFCSF